jgi:MFS family permease
MTVDSSFTPIERRNFTINIAEGALYVAGAAFISGQTVLPALVSRLGGGNVAVGSVAVILWVGLFLPQVFAARYVETLPWKKPWAIWGGVIQRMFLLLLAFSVFAFGRQSPATALACVLIFYALSQIGLGITTPGWFDLFAKVTPVRRRGRLIGMRNSIGGAAAFVCGLALTWMLSHFAFPINYSLVFFCAFAFQVFSVIVQLNIVEEQPSNTVAKKGLGEYVRQIPGVLKQNKRFRRFMVMSAFLVVASMPVGFFTVYALNRFGGGESMVGKFTLAMVAVQVVSGFANGYIADHYGHRIALVLAAAGMLGASIVALVAPSLAWFTLAYVFLGINLGSELMLRYNMSIEYGPVELRSTYVGLMNTVLAPFYLSSIAGGWISDQFGYHVVFVLGALSSIIGILLLIFRVEDPHSPRTIHPRRKCSR